MYLTIVDNHTALCFHLTLHDVHLSQCLYINLYYMFIEKQERRWLRFYHPIRNLIKSTDRTHLLVIYWPLLCGGGSGWAMFDRFPCVGGRGSSCFLEIAHVYLYREIRNEFVAMIDKWYSFFSPNLWTITCEKNLTIKEVL